MSSRDPGLRLGRGLAALMGDVVPGSTDQGPRLLAAILLEPGPFQPRAPIDPADLAELTNSIRTHGVLQPLLVRPHPQVPGRFQIIAGERRWRAAQAAGLDALPTLVRAFTDPAAMAAALVENLQRQDLNAMEEAEGFRRLLDEFSLTQEALATAVGRSRSHIANTVRLLNLPTAVQQEVRRGNLSAGHARALLAHPEPAKAALQVISRALTVRETEALAGHKASSPGAGDTRNAGSGRVRDPETAAIARELTERLGLQVSIALDGAGGSVRIVFRKLDQLDSLIALLMGT